MDIVNWFGFDIGFLVLGFIFSDVFFFYYFFVGFVVWNGVLFIGIVFVK